MDVDSYKDCKQFDIAICDDDAKSVAKLIDAGAPIDYEYYFGYPIRLAARLNCLKVIKLLAERGANLDVVGLRSGDTALHIACLVDNYDTVKLLLGLGANPDVRDGRDHLCTPLHIEAQRSNTSYFGSAKLLLDYGADVFAKDWIGISVVRYAVCYKRQELINLMIEKHGRKVKAAVTRAQKDFDLIDSAEANDLAGVKQAVARGANVNAIDPSPMHALRYAAMHGNNAMIKLLLRNKALVSLRADLSSETALLNAAWKGHRETVDLLLAKGADLLEEFVPAEEVQKNRDFDAVAYAREGGHMELYEYLKDLRSQLRRERRKEEREELARDRGKTTAKKRKAKTKSTSKKSATKKLAHAKAKKAKSKKTTKKRANARKKAKATKKK